MAQSPISPQILHCLYSVFMINVKVRLEIKRQKYALNKRKTDKDMLGKPTNRKFDCTYFPPYCCTHNIWRQSAVPTGRRREETDIVLVKENKETDFLEASTVLPYFVRS